MRLGQACDNLVSNAVKFTPAGGQVTLTVSAGWQSADGTVTADERPGAAPVAQLSVRDTGIGIPNDEQGKLFTRFFRASTAQRSAVPGVGLGLSITKAITTAHGGTLDLVSAEGEGTTFTLTLPRDVRDLGATAPPSPPRGRGRSASPRKAAALFRGKAAPSGSGLGARAEGDGLFSCGFLAVSGRVACGRVSRVLLVAGRAGDTDSGRTR